MAVHLLRHLVTEGTGGLWSCRMQRQNQFRLGFIDLNGLDLNSGILREQAPREHCILPFKNKRKNIGLANSSKVGQSHSCTDLDNNEINARGISQSTDVIGRTTMACICGTVVFCGDHLRED